VKVLYHPDCKDPSALHIKDPDGFPKAWQEVIATAVPPGSVPPPAPPAPGLFPQPSGEPRISPWGIPVRNLAFGQMGYEWNRIASRCACLYCDILRYDRNAGEWFRFDGTRWRASTSRSTARKFLYTTIDGLQEEAHTIEGDNDENRRARNLIIDMRRRMFRDNTVFRIIEQLSCEEEILSHRNDFDQRHQLINFPNGTFDLNTGQLRPHQADDMITHVMGTAYDPHAKCPMFMKFLNRLIGDDPEMVDYLQRAVGYTATGFTREHCLFFMYGLGGNGKGTFMKTLLACMGSYATQIKAETIVNSASEKSYYDIADLPGIRLAVCTELPQDRNINESLIKEMVSEDRMKARHLFERFFAFDPSHKLWMSGNHKPPIRGTDKGMWRRIRLLDMDAKIRESEKDPQLFDKLVTELPGICAWLVQGAVKWYSDGKLITPTRVQNDTNEYMDECDPLVDFLDECTVADTNAETKKVHLYMAYTDWCFRIGDRRPMGKITFLRTIEERGYKSKRKSTERVISGIRLIDEPQGRRRPSDRGTQNWELGFE
jgi:putative DNA primase/helicase